MYQRYNVKNLTIDQVINQRLQMSFNQKILKDQFNIEEANFNKVTSSKMLSEFKKWDETKKHKFLVALGGPLNYERSKGYFNSLLVNKKI